MPEKTLEALITEREKEGLKVAHQIADFIAVLGYLRPDGDLQLDEDAVRFFHNRLLNTVTVEHGSVEMLRVNLTTKSVPLFKNGTWQLIFDRVLGRFEAADASTVAKKNEVRIRENMGLPKV